MPLALKEMDSRSWQNENRIRKTRERVEKCRQGGNKKSGNEVTWDLASSVRSGMMGFATLTHCTRKVQEKDSQKYELFRLFVLSHEKSAISGKGKSCNAIQ